MRILVTAGASREPIDAVRFLSNIGTGATGAALADAFAARGHQVALFHAVGSAPARLAMESELFSSAEDLRERLERRLAGGEIDAVVMTAAVADYRPERAREGELASEADRMELTLVRNPKILPLLKSYSPRALFVVGFKL